MVRAMSDDLYNDARWLVGAIARGLHARGGSHVDVVLQRLAAQDMTREDFVEPRPQNLARHPLLRRHHRRNHDDRVRTGSRHCLA